MPNQTIKILGKLVNTNKQPLSKLRIEAWDADGLVNASVGKAVSDENGKFEITFTPQQYEDLFRGKTPDIYIKVFEGEKLVHNTKNTVVWDVDGERNNFEIVVGATAEDDSAPNRLRVTRHPIRPVSFGETSMRINLLHKTLRLFGFPVSAEEEKTHTAGESTLRQVRTLQAQFNIKYDKEYVVDQATYDRLMEEIVKADIPGKSDSFVVTGTVYDRTGDTVKSQKLIALDVDLRGAAVYRTVESINDVQKHGGFEFLSQGYANFNGYYHFEFYGFQFEEAERLKADVIVYALDQNGEIIGRSRLINSDDYSNTGEAGDLDVLITKVEERTEYEILTGKLLPFLKENKVELIELADSNEQVAFTSGELDENQIKIQTIVDAESLRLGRKENDGENENFSCPNLSNELLYGIGRQDIALDWLVLFKKTDGELKNAIEESVKDKIIKEHDEQIIAGFLKLIHQCATKYTLRHKDENQPVSLEKMLSAALPEKEQQTAFVNAYRNFKSENRDGEQIDYKNFWTEYLPQADEFKDKPELISSLLLNQQLLIISGNHQPLIEELQVERKISTVTQLMDLEDDELKEIVKKTGVPEFITGENEEEKINSYANQIQTLLNAAYPTKKIALMVKKQELNVEDENARNGISNFLSKSEKFDFTSSRVSEFEDEIKVAAPDHIDSVKTELMRMQRVFQVSPTPAVMSVLLENKLDSAQAISSIPETSFGEMHADKLGGQKYALEVHQRAGFISTRAKEIFAKIRETALAESPAFAYSDCDREEVIELLKNEIPNYSELFGSPDMCECEHCRSVYSASAYFVELLRFLSKSTKNFVEKSPLDIFAARRPDLSHLPLTCENTNTIIPYIDLVNEVMEYYTVHDKLDENAAFDTGDTTAQELRANPQNFEPEAYRILKNAVYPFSLPFHQPLDVIRTYSDHLKIERYEIMKAMQKDLSPEAFKAIESEALRISEEEYRVLTLQNFNGGDDLDELNTAEPKPKRQLQQYYGFPYANPEDVLELDPVKVNMEKVAGIGVKDGIHEFLRRAGVKYTDLVELVKTRFINPHQNILEYLEQLFVKSKLDVYSKLQQINAGTLDPSDDSDLMLVLENRNIPPADFAEWVRKNFENFNSIITLYQPQSACDLDTTSLKTLRNIYADSTSSGITNETWSKIHRFIRLWRKLGWTIHEVDLMLSALGENDISDTTISKLSNVVLLNKHLKLPINQLATFWGSIDSYGDKSLYKKLFLNKAVQRIDEAFKPDEFENYLSDSDEVLENHIPAILAAFRMSEADLTAIIETANINTATDKLNIYNLSVIYRYTILSKALKLKVPDLCLFKKLFDSQPFSILSATSGEPVFEDISPSDTFDFYILAASIKQSGFKADVLQYIFNGTLPAKTKLGIDKEKTKQTVRDIRQDFLAIERSYPSNLTPLTTEILRDNLSLTFKADVVNHLIGIIKSQQSFTVVTDSGLPVAIPDSLASKFSYKSLDGKLTVKGIMSEKERDDLKLLESVNDNFKSAIDSLYVLSNAVNADSPLYSSKATANLDIDEIPESLSPKFTYTKASGRLTYKGIMSDVEKDELKALSADENFRDAVDAIYRMPEDFISDNFSGVFANAVLDTALVNLINRPIEPEEQQTPEDKLKFVYDNYLPLLKEKLREDTIVKHLASLIGLSREATLILVKDEVPTLIESIALEGFSAEYFSNPTLTAPPAITLTDSKIDFDWQLNTPDSAVPADFPADNFSVRWQSYLVAPSSGEYTLIVEIKEPDEAFNLYLDDALILVKARGDAQTSWEFTDQLNASRMHKLVLEYTESVENAGIKLSWKTATSGVEIIPSTSSFPAVVIDSFTEIAEKLHRAYKFITGFKLTETEVNHFVNYSADFADIDFTEISATNWQRINDYVRLRNAVPQSQALLTDVFVAANIAEPVPTVENLTGILHLATGWNVNTLTDLITSHFELSVDDFKNEIALKRIYDAVSFVLKIGLSVQNLAQWATTNTDFDELNSTADLVKNAVKAKYEEDDWLKLAGDLSDKIRENQKQALINYLLTKQEFIDSGITDADGLFEYFLIDVQMGACMDTSRIVQANAAVQMFINRCFLNLESDKRPKSDSDSTKVEKGISPDSIDRKQWEWMKNYRVWEVNRKIFLYPENWLEPEWRDDRSEFFKELESELTQNDITDRNVETAFRNYFTKMNTVANLDICGMYQENNADGEMKKIHVFGRTHNAPYQFFYRTYNESYKWSAWEKVQVDIRMTEDGEDSGVHLVPVVWKNRLFIFWAEFMEKQEKVERKKKNGQEKTFGEMAEENSPSDLESKKYWEMRLAWSEFIDGKWSPKQLSKEFSRIISDSRTKPIKNIILQSNVENGVLDITPYLKLNLIGSYVKLPYFLISDIHSQILVNNNPSEFADKLYESDPRYALNYEKHSSISNLEFWDNTYLENTINHNIVFSNNALGKEEVSNEPFFYQDANRTYFACPTQVKVWDYILKPILYPPMTLFPVRNSNKLKNTNILGRVEFSDFEITGNINSRRTVSGETSIGMPLTNNTESGTLLVNNILGTDSEHSLYDTYDIGKSFSGITKHGNKLLPEKQNFHWERKMEFHTFHHPFSSEFVTNLNRDGITGLMDSDTKLNNDKTKLAYNDSGENFVKIYDPDFSQGLVKEAPLSDEYKPGERYTFYKDNICFDVFGANSIYNWELFFHAPLYIATRLSKNGKYEEAMKWFHYIFDPTTNEMPLPGHCETSRYWKTLPFKTTPSKKLAEWFESLSPVGDSEPEDPTIAEWRKNPFNPFIIARNRPIAFMKNVVIKYVENLRAWGDSLFKMFTRESVNEALQLYVIANHILGPRPEFVPKRGKIKAETYYSFKDKWDSFSNALVEMENIFPYSSSVPVSKSSSTSGLSGAGKELYFCIPPNENLMEHWDTIADRLYKIRHCMDIEGVERQLALFSPPIDPALLINAAAQGLSLGSILSDLSSPPPIYRFNYLLQKANEFCGEVKSLGNAVLSALEKKDGEELGRLRASHETAMLDLITAIKERQVLDARVNKEALLKSRETAEFRLKHYNALLSEEPLTIPDIQEIEADVNAESQLPADTSINKFETDVDESLVDGDESGVKLISKEQNEINKLNEANNQQHKAAMAELLASILHVIPTAKADGTPLGVGVGGFWGGTQLGNAMNAFAKGFQLKSSKFSHEAVISSKMASYIRREQDWTLQANLAAKEIIQLDKQIISADIKIQVSEKELFNHKQQIENSKQVEQFLKDKFTNQELYQWMKEQLFSVYKQSFNLAYEMAKKAEKCYRYELGNEITSFIQYGYWDNMMQGLCAGEKLQLSLRQMEKSYLEENRRELELTKSVSMALLNPLALQQLRTTGECSLAIPEEFYDLDYQGHYFRRIKSVSLSLPCIAGPYTTVNCTLRLVKNTVRINTSGESYEHNNEEGIPLDDNRFRESIVPVKAIATSSGQRDSGMFEFNFRDERYLPFEGAGAVSEWKIELTKDTDLRQFDYSTISDVILHINYTAREDAGLFKEKSVNHLKNYFTEAAESSPQPLIRMFSLKHDFSTEWHKFLNPSNLDSDQILSFKINREHFPFFTKERNVDIKKIEILIKANRTGEYQMVFIRTDLDENVMTSDTISMPENPVYGNMQKATLTASTVNANLDIFESISLKLKHNDDPDFRSLNSDTEEISDIFLVFHYVLGDLITERH